MKYFSPGHRSLLQRNYFPAGGVWRLVHAPSTMLLMILSEVLSAMLAIMAESSFGILSSDKLLKFRIARVLRNYGADFSKKMDLDFIEE